MKAVAVKQLQQANPQLYNAREVDERILKVIGWDDVDSMFNPPQPPGPDPMADAMKSDAQAKMLSAQAKLKDANTKAQQAQNQAAGSAATAATRLQDIKSRENIAAMNLQKEMVIHNDKRQDSIASDVADRISDANQLASDNQNAAMDREQQQQQQRVI
jgi:hypothetical protein